MINIVRGCLEQDERPAYLKSSSKSRNTPMKRRADVADSAQKPRSNNGIEFLSQEFMHCEQCMMTIYNVVPCHCYP
ncbi:hypothetical protein SeMB42_g06966 [Synchytrium endobioticum]|uniref:Uncharacterized protein n=1 Tax=Synchytrium endobioticum TaxID=286115 RepID=A0A507C4R2_9FUNG|nr:hypothetical protein SeMB42_g07384 [Synchytrium endobioticum]TPX37270.1 hypothetical protein SeMB42_g06966 [Synchytrium endobioticum]